MEQQMYYLIKDLGFPIAMVLYFMIINNSTIQKNTKALHELKLVLAKKV